MSPSENPNLEKLIAAVNEHLRAEFTLSPTSPGVDAENEELERAKVEANLEQVVVKETVDYEDALKRVNLATSQDNRTMRKWFGIAMLVFTSLWSVFAWTIVVFQGFGIWGFSLANEPLTALLGASIASALGLMAAVLRGIFPTKDQK